MMRSRYISIVICLLLSLSSSAQKQKEPGAKEQINMLKNGALFIRLKTSENLINALIAKGKTEEAEKVKQEQYAKNKEIAKAFSEHLTFCKVYFFYSNNSTKISSGNYQGCLMNASLETDTSFEGNDYLTAEFDESETTGIDAFVIKDKNFKQLKSPFPFMIRLNKTLVIERKKEEVAIELNQKLQEFYLRNKGGKKIKSATSE